MSDVWMEPCIGCGFRSELGCTCNPSELWYQCKLEPEPDWGGIMKREGDNENDEEPSDKSMFGNLWETIM